MEKRKEMLYALELIKWISEYPGYWLIVCNTYGEEKVGLTAMTNTIKSLQKNRFYDLILVFLMTHRDTAAIRNVKESLLLKSIAEQIESGNGDQFVADLLDLLS
ncbi:MAG: hypothetical protein ACRDBO_03930 [Lachnospiraceae bacterium]